MTDNQTPDTPAKAALDDRATTGPLDESEANPVRPYIDLGGIKILPREGLNLRLEVEEQTKRIVRRRPRLRRLDPAGPAVRRPAHDRTVGRDARADPRAGPPAGRPGRGAARGRSAPSCSPRSPSSRTRTARAAAALARFVGVDGPRWFLRGVIGGAATSDVEAAAKVEDLFRSHRRGARRNTDAAADLIPLRMPTTRVRRDRPAARRARGHRSPRRRSRTRSAPPSAPPRAGRDSTPRRSRQPGTSSGTPWAAGAACWSRSFRAFVFLIAWTLTYDPVARTGNLILSLASVRRGSPRCSP